MVDTKAEIVYCLRGMEVTMSSVPESVPPSRMATGIPCVACGGDMMEEAGERFCASCKRTHPNVNVPAVILSLLAICVLAVLGLWVIDKIVRFFFA